MMTIALGFGFLPLFIPGINFARLHIFFYNLCTGGTILLYFTENKKKMSLKVSSYLVLAIVYALLAFFERYVESIILGLILAVMVESVRIKRFQLLPWDFFSSKVPTAEKFHQAALLCLSMGLAICSFAIWNEEFVHLLSFDKLTLNTFFLGFSFPLSLITFSVVFEAMHKADTKIVRDLKPIMFWTITLGVISFFIFILMESAMLELVISSILYIAVAIVLWMYIKLGIHKQQKAILTSGITFLLLVATTGIVYILFYMATGNTLLERSVFLHYHAIVALYGWNLSGLSIICRYNDFPIRLNETRVVVLHWVVVLFLAPLGYYFKSIAIIALVMYFGFLLILFFSEGSQKFSETGAANT